MSDYQNLIFTGNVGNVDHKFLESGVEVLNFSVGSNKNRKNDAGEWETKTTWFGCAVFGERCSYLVTKIEKGAKVFVNGTLITDDNGNPQTWLKEGEPRSAFKVLVNTVVVASQPKDKEEEDITDEDFFFG